MISILENLNSHKSIESITLGKQLEIQIDKIENNQYEVLRNVLSKLGVNFENLESELESDKMRICLKRIPKIFYTNYFKNEEEIRSILTNLIQSLIKVSIFSKRFRI